MLSGSTLTLSTRVAEINRATEHAAAFCREQGITDRKEPVLKVVLEELITNSIRHGQPPTDAIITITLTRIEREIHLYYVDAGSPFDPHRDLPPDTRDQPLERRPVGGLGWALIFHYCKTIKYERRQDENHYEMVLELPSSR